MAKKENKAVGYLVLSVIPIFGIIWAAVAGGLHNGHVKDAREAEVKFEKEFVEVLNNIAEFKGANYNVESLNITSIVPTFYATKLKGDNISTNNSSYTVKISANPEISVNDKGEKYAKSFDLTFEFFINQTIYSELAEAYANENITLIGYKDYVYETYYPNNPRSTPIYAVAPIFNKYHSNILYLEYKGDTLIGFSADTVMELIDSIPTTLEVTKKALDDYNKLLKSIETEYNLLDESKKAQVENYVVYQNAIKLHAAKSVQFSISEIASAPFAMSTQTKLNDARKAYNKLDDEQKTMVENYAQLVEAEFNYPMWKVAYYVNKDSIKDSDITNAVKFYNQLSAEQKAKFDADTLEKLIKKVNEYNENKPDDKKLTLNLPNGND